MRASSQAAREAAERQSALDVQEASISLQTARRTLELYRTELIPQAEARFSASEAGYRTGRVDFMDLLESERFLLGAKIMAAMAEGTLGMQAARLERAVGGGRTWL
jgi:cobalt-zinc-cadmium efflux system outer membrane protein